MKALSEEYLISPSQAAVQAMKGVEAYELGTRETFKAATSQAKPTTPVLVERLDYANSYYYIVPVAKKAKAGVPLAVIVDGRTGVYNQSIVSATGTENILSLNDPEQAASMVIGQDIQLPGMLGRLHVLPQAVSRHPTMVWKP